MKQAAWLRSPSHLFVLISSDAVVFHSFSECCLALDRLRRGRHRLCKNAVKNHSSAWRNSSTKAALPERAALTVPSFILHEDTRRNCFPGLHHHFLKSNYVVLCRDRFEHLNNRRFCLGYDHKPGNQTFAV